MGQVRIFLASSLELKPERDNFEAEINRKNKSWKDRGIDIFIYLDIWEDLSAQMSENGSQSEYNKRVKIADLFILLAYTKMGMYTAEEFDEAYAQFKATQKPAIFTYFKNSTNTEPSLDGFKDKLSGMGHFYSPFNDSNDLWNQFNKELDRLETSFSKPQPFNEHITKELMLAIRPYCPISIKYLDAVKSKPDWNKIADLSNKAKEILACNYVGLIGIQIRKLMAIGMEGPSDNKMRNYVDNCIATGKRTLQLLCFALISDLWNQGKDKDLGLTDEQKEPLNRFFENWIELPLMDYAGLFNGLCNIYKGLGLALPIPELADITASLEAGSDLDNAISKLHTISETPDSEKYTIQKCNAAELHLTTLLTTFSFLAAYKMVSIKSIGYEEIRNTSPRYLHNYVSLGFESKANTNMEKLNYINEPISTDSILLYKGNYLKGINLFPFVIDLSALSFESGVKICFFSSVDMGDDNMNYCFLEDNSNEVISYYDSSNSGTQLNDLMNDKEMRKKIRISTVFSQFREAKNTILGSIDLSNL